MTSFKRIPLFKYLVCFIGGIVLATYTDIAVEIVLAFFAVILSTTIAFHFVMVKRVRMTMYHLTSFFVLLLFFLSGVLITKAHDSRSYGNHFCASEPHQAILVRIVSQPKASAKSVGFTASIVSVRQDSISLHAQGKAQVYLAQDAASKSLKYGDYVLLHSKLRSIDPARNPHQFDFKKYYTHQNIHHQGFFKSGEWISTGENKGNFLLRWSYQWRDILKERFDAHFENQEAKGVAEAIIFGYKEDLDQDWMDAFSKTGTILVLAVSGLHVGIIFFLLSSILGLSGSKGWSLWFKSAIAVLVLFLYALLTGFSPSVSRAALMFSAVIVGKAIGRDSSIYNTLCFAAFILVLIDPMSIFNVGFQFSFLAVVGIVFYNDYFRALLPQSTWLGDRIVSLLAVSLAAQLATFPLGLYYFHQFPNYFLVSNLIVIPYITVILYAGIFFGAFGWLADVIAQFFAWLTEAYIQFIYAVVHFLEKLPFAFFQDVHITFGQMLLMYLFIVAVTYAMVVKRARAFIVAVGCVLAFLVIDYNYTQDVKKTEVVCFDVRNKLFLGFKTAKSVTFLGSDDVLENLATYRYTIGPFVTNERYANQYQVFPLSSLPNLRQCNQLIGDKNGTVWFNNTSYLILDEMKSYVNDTLQVDVLIIGSRKNQNYLTKVLPLINYNKCVVLNSWLAEDIMNLVDNKKTETLANGFVILK